MKDLGMSNLLLGVKKKKKLSFSERTIELLKEVLQLNIFCVKFFHKASLGYQHLRRPLLKG